MKLVYYKRNNDTGGCVRKRQQWLYEHEGRTIELVEWSDGDVWAYKNRYDDDSRNPDYSNLSYPHLGGVLSGQLKILELFRLV